MFLNYLSTSILRAIFLDTAAAPVIGESMSIYQKGREIFEQLANRETVFLQENFND